MHIFGLFAAYIYTYMGYIYMYLPVHNLESTQKILRTRLERK